MSGKADNQNSKSSHSKTKSITAAIGHLFSKSKDNNKGNSKERDRKKDPSNDVDSSDGRGRSNSVTKIGSPNVVSDATPPKVDTPEHNGRVSHNDADSNTSGDVNGTTKQNSPPQQVESVAIATKEDPNNRPPSPIEDTQSPPQSQPQKRVSPAPPTTSHPDIVFHLAPKESGELNGSLSPDLSQPSRLKKKSSGFVPLPFVESGPKGDATPTARQRSSGPPEILPEEITYEESDLVGHGSFGSVYKGKCRGQEVAIKVPKKQKLTMAELTSFRNEVKVMSVIYHPHVVLFLGASTQLGKMQIITERCMTDLEKLLANDRDKKHYTLAHRMQMAKDAALGVNWLHSKCNIVHLDLKSANLLLDHNMRVKVTDFGFATIKESLAADKAKKGTPLWMAPEVMMGNKYDEKADVYSFGIILWEILTREIPYAHHNDYQTFFRAVCIDKERPPIPPNTPLSLEHLITSCWDFNPQKRPSFEEIIFRLNEVLVDCCLENDQARDLWKQHFLLPKQELVEQVPWSEFESVIKRSVGRNVNLEALRPYLVCAARDPILKGKEVVIPERFDKLLKWFGLFF